MLKTNNPESRTKFRNLRRSNQIIDEYISFIHRAYPNEEKNQFTLYELRSIAAEIGISGVSEKEPLYHAIRSTNNYMNYLRKLP